MRLLLLTTLSALIWLLAGCTMTTATVGTECVVWRPITWSSKDTPDTVTEVKANNARRNAWCGTPSGSSGAAPR